VEGGAGPACWYSAHPTIRIAASEQIGPRLTLVKPRTAVIARAQRPARHVLSLPREVYIVGGACLASLANHRGSPALQRGTDVTMVASRGGGMEGTFGVCKRFMAHADSRTPACVLGGTFAHSMQQHKHLR
jgi:hypothetical protein